MDSNACLASHPVKTSMRHKEKSRFSARFIPKHGLNSCLVVFLVPRVVLLKKQSLSFVTQTKVNPFKPRRQGRTALNMSKI